MGGGGDGRPARDTYAKKRSTTLDQIGKTGPSRIKDDLKVLKNLWFHRASGGDHAARLESFYKGQASLCEQAVSIAVHWVRSRISQSFLVGGSAHRV